MRGTSSLYGSTWSMRRYIGNPSLVHSAGSLPSPWRHAASATDSLRASCATTEAAVCGLRYGGLYRSGVRVNPTPAMGMTTSPLRFPEGFPRPRASRTREREFRTQYMPQEARPLRWRVENTRHGQITVFLDDTMHYVNNVLGHSLSPLFSYTHEHFCPSNEEHAAWLRGPLQRSLILQTSDEQTNAQGVSFLVALVPRRGAKYVVLCRASIFSRCCTKVRFP